MHGARHTVPWRLRGSCPCYFRLLCDETNMVHFFSGVNSRCGEPLPRRDFREGSRCHHWLGVSKEDSALATVCWRVRGHSGSGRLLSPLRTSAVGETSSTCQGSQGLWRRSPQPQEGVQVSAARTTAQVGHRSEDDRDQWAVETAHRVSADWAAGGGQVWRPGVAPAL